MKYHNYKIQGKKSLFAKELSLEQLSSMGNPLEAISNVIDFEMFRKPLEAKLLNHRKTSKAGARPYDVVLMFKIMILQRYYNLSDRQAEYQIIDRTSFRDFLGIDTGDKVPDEKTIWAFRESLTKTGLTEELFKQFVKYLTLKGLIFNEGQIVDASYTIAPRQRNTPEENKAIKDGKGEELWNNNSDKKSHKDIDARWSQKNGETYFGYKNHLKVDKKSKFINTFVVSDAGVHDSQVLEHILTTRDRGQELYGDSGYTGEKQEQTISRYRMQNKIHKKGYRNHPLSKKQRRENMIKSKTRSRVEHVFGFMEQSMNGLMVRSVGIMRATGIIGLMNLTYNIFRYEQVK